MAAEHREIGTERGAKPPFEKSAQRVRTLLGNLPGIVFRCRGDRDRTMEFVSDGCAALTGYQPAELVAGGPTRYASLIHPGDRQTVWKQVQRALSERRRFECEYRIKTKEGRTRWMWEQGRGVFGADGKVLALEGLIVNIDGRKGQETTLRDDARRMVTGNKWLLASKDVQEQTEDTLTHSNREFDDFAYIASHDLKEPLRGIHYYAAFLMEDYANRLDDDGRNKLQTLIRLSQRLSSLIDTLLDYSRLGLTELAIQPTDLNEVLDDVLDTLEPALRERGTEIRKPRPLPTVDCDRVWVTELFRNLITNAMKYNDKSDPWIEIGDQDGSGAPTAGDLTSSRHRDSPITLHVRDNGIGIAKKHHDTVFRIFKRLHTRDEFGGGSGAGLTIVRRIVARHGGQIRLESHPGVGTTIYFTLGRGSQDDQSRRSQERACVGD